MPTEKKRFLKRESVVMFLRDDGREFQVLGIEEEKARSETNFKRVFGIVKSLSEEERSVREGW